LRREDFRFIVVRSKEAKMRQKSGPEKPVAEQVIKDIRRATRKHHSAEDKIRIVLEGLRGADSIAALCRREPKASTTVGRRNFSKLARSAWPAIRRVLRPLTR
jgi:transposase